MDRRQSTVDRRTTRYCRLSPVHCRLSDPFAFAGIVAHAGEEGPPEYVWSALDLLKVERIDHGVQSAKDPALMKRLAAERIPLTVCPLSNLRLRGVRDMKDHPLRRMMDAGLKVTINSDDPAYFGGYINENFSSVGVALGISAAELTEIARNSFAASFMPDGDKQRALAAFGATR